MAKTENDLTIDRDWQDLVATYPGLGGAGAYVQNKSFYTDRHLLVVFSPSAVAPTERNGLRLPAGDVAQGTADHIWVRAYHDDVLISCGSTD